MIMNYNNWFYNQHKYLVGNRDGKESFNDTKWVNINKRYKTLVDMSSELLSQQPYAVMGNNKGFDKLLDLMARSNYTFEDINESLIDTYKVSLQNAMSRNLVNTHCVVSRCTNLDSNVTPDKFTHYWIIDVPFNQFHFGDRDEFIRQRLHEIHTTENDKYLNMSRMMDKDIYNILGFTLICTVNGYICNDCKVAIDDKGFKFKVGWPYSSDVEFIIYKLDESKVISKEIKSKLIYGESIIPYTDLSIINKDDVIDRKCIINIYDKRFVKTSPSVPNFGIFTDKGLEIRNIQKTTINAVERQSSNTVMIDIYAIKYIHEVPNVFPAVNYYDIMDSQRVYDDRYENITDTDGNVIISTNTRNINNLEKCTPPITLDRDVHYSFNVICSCVGMYDYMMKFESDFKKIGNDLLSSSLTYEEFIKNDKPILDKLYDTFIGLYNSYQQGAILTSLVSSDDIDAFTSLIKNIYNLKNASQYSDIQKYSFDELYESNYMATVKKITSPFHDNALSNFTKMTPTGNNYFEYNNYTRFNRPVAEQCFITLKYNHEEDCWLFAYPEIKHFKGIGNTFYIDSNLKGDEIFKFFVLYTDTENACEKGIDHFDLNTIMDFDEFFNQVEKHIGYIRYWDAENRLMKMSKMLYNKYDDETCVHIFSKILKRKLSGESLLNEYPSEINYEASNITSDNWENYDEDSVRSPFAINFMFYTLSMLNDNEDKLQSYFYRMLTGRKYDIRYADIKLNNILEKHEYPVNYSQITIAPDRLSEDCSKPLSTIPIYYGLPLISKIDGSPLYNSYRYVFNVYNDNISLPLIVDNSINKEYYVRYNNPNDYGSSVIMYNDIIKLAQMMTKYLSTVYDCISEIQTNYKKSYNITSTIESYTDTINKHIDDITAFVDGKIFPINVDDVVSVIIDKNKVLTHINAIHKGCRFIREINFNALDISAVGFINKLIGLLKQVYVNTGFDNYIMKRARMLYINLKKINTVMNPYEYREWLLNLDIELLNKLDDMMAANENYTLGNNVFRYYYDTLKIYIEKVYEATEQLHDNIRDLNDDVNDVHIKPITEFCDNVINNFIFDMFIIDKISYDNTIEYSTKPAYIVINVSSVKHINIPADNETTYSDVYLVFQPIIENTGNSYHINMISNICEYVFFNGDTINDVTMKILDQSGNVISSQTISITFVKVSSTADSINTFNQIPNMLTTKIDFENVHESFEVVNDMIVNEKHADMNYEMLIGNHFVQLPHETELVLQPKTWLQGSIDRIYIENSFINKLCAIEYSHRKCNRMFFKPSQIFHIANNDDGSIDSVNGKYFEGQTIYLKTDDGLTYFPAIVTKIDHSINKGFIEARVDDWNAKWFEIDDNDMITKYLTENITCTTIDDNISNFLDEFSNSSYKSYSNVVYNQMLNNMNDVYELPGDPLFVSTNADFVYNRLNWFFNELVPNRYIDEEHKTHKFIYVDNGFINNENDVIKIHAINHNMNTLTNPEMYPILRSEPNDHLVWNEEIRVFKSKQFQSYQELQSLDRKRQMAEAALEHATTQSARNDAIDKIDQIDRDINKLNNLIDRLELYIRQLETPTTWYNVISYDASLVYIANGRADKFSPVIIPNIRDILYTDKLDVFLYDWEHKLWLDPSTYSIETNIIDSIKIDECDDYTTNRVLHSITIKPNTGFNFSKNILVYFSYDVSNVYDDIEMNNNKCLVRFKPLLSLDPDIDNYDPYSDIRIRKHFDGFEKYKYDNIENGVINVKRIKRNGKYTYSPAFRVCDITFTDSNGDHTYVDIDKFYVRSPFKDVSTTRQFCIPNFNATIITDIDNFVKDTIVKLICISNNDSSSYDGNISDVMFTARTSIVNNKQQLTILDSTLRNYTDNHSYTCTVFRNDDYKAYGGVIVIDVESVKQDILNDDWVLIPNEFLKYRELPMEFMFTIKNPVENDSIIVTLKNEYLNNLDDEINVDNENLNNPYEYYYDTKNYLRLPISDTRINSHDKRLTIDTDINTNINVIKAPYIGICRYSTQLIPEDGLIDLTGYVATPLSRDRYEFWINGRCIVNMQDLIILSPTSIQLCNMKSLRNFEVIELVDDVDSDSELLNKGTLYVDINGNSYSTYKLAMLSNTRINRQDIMFTFNANNHKNIHDYTKNIISNPNNRDIEEDILNTITFDENVNDYNKLFNIPSINGITIFHPKLNNLGISEIPADKIIELFDKVWKLESMTNPIFAMTHRPIISETDEIGLTLIVKQIDDEHWNGLSVDTRGMFVVHIKGITDKYFSLYISKTSNGKIDDIDNTVKIIPFISSGTYVLLDKTYKGMWIHSTHPNTTPIRIINAQK